MDSFPAKDLPPQLAAAFLEAYLDGEITGPSPVLEAYGRSSTGGLPQPVLTTEQRVLGLATVWSEVKYNFAYWDRLPGEAWWDSCFAEFLPRVTSAASDREYWDMLKEFVLLLGEAHTQVLRPRHLQTDLASPPLWLMAVEGRPMVIEGEELPRGTEILAIDGQPADEARTALARTVITSTPQSTAALTAAWLLRGPEDSTVTVTVRLPAGAVREYTLKRTTPRLARPPIKVRDLGSGFLQVEVNAMIPEVVQQFDEQFPTFAGVSGLIIDLRWNNGSSSHVSNTLLARLVQTPVRAPDARVGVYIPFVRAINGTQRWLRLSIDPVMPDRERPGFDGPIAVLTSPLTGSAAEDFLVVYVESRRGVIVGEATAGSTGQPLSLLLPGGGVLQITTLRERFPDGTEFVGHGVMPTIHCAPTIVGLAAGRDEVLERAMAYLVGEE